MAQGWIYWGVRGGGGGVHPLARARGVQGCYFFMIKQKIIGDKMRYSNLSKHMVASGSFVSTGTFNHVFPPSTGNRDI
jgi:hypothetical protein